MKCAKSLSLPNDCFVIGHVGRLTSEKNHYFMLDVLNEFVKSNKKVRLLLVGGGPLKESILARAKEIGVDKYVMMMGVRNDVPKLLMVMDAFCFHQKMKDWA